MRKNLITKSIGAFELEIFTAPQRLDSPGNLSGAEVLLDALSNHRCALFTELEELRDKWAKKETATLEQIKESFASDFVYLMEQVKALDYYIDLIATGVAAKLRGQMVEVSSLDEAASEGNH